MEEGKESPNGREQATGGLVSFFFPLCRARLLLSLAVSDRCFIGIRIDVDGPFQMSLHLDSPPLQVR